MNKRGEMHLSFGMIFSIILIIFFIAFAFYAIQKFLGLQDTIKIEKFADDLQRDVDTVWQSSQASQEFEYFIPKKIEAVCFTGDEFENLVFESNDVILGKKIEKISLGTQDRVCFDNDEGKVKIKLSKNFGENLVTVSENGEN